MRVEDVTLWGRDYSATEWSPEMLDRYEQENPRERPVQWLWRYIGYPSNRKCISFYRGAYEAHWNAGRPVSLIHQIGYSDMGTGYDGGRAHARTALADANAVGWDGETHITACMDRFYAKAGYPTLNAHMLSEYMRGFRSVLGDRTGFYGFYDSMRDAINGGWASFYLQCGARSAHVNGIHAWQENNYQPKIFGVPTDQLELYCAPEYAFGGVNELSWNDRFKTPNGDQEYAAWQYLTWSNYYDNMIPGVVQMLEAQGKVLNDHGKVLAKIAQDSSNNISLTPEDLEKLQAGVGGRMEIIQQALHADLLKKQAEQTAFLAERFSLDEEEVKTALDEWFDQARLQRSKPTPPSGG